MKSHTSAEKFLLLGDYTYQSTGTCFFNLINSKGMKAKSNIAIGNHEDESSEGFSAYMSLFGLSKTYYAFTYGNARVIVMDSDHSSYSSGSSQYNFVISETSKCIPKFKHKVDNCLYSQTNVYVTQYMWLHSCSNTGSDATNLRNIYHAKFVQYGVDVVLNGHLHNYQRTFPIKYDSGSPSSPTKTSSASTNTLILLVKYLSLLEQEGLTFMDCQAKHHW